MLKKFLFPLGVLAFVIIDASAQSLPFDFESAPVASDFVNFDGGIASVVSNPSSDAVNSSATVGQIIRNGGQIWGGSKILLSSPLDFTTNSTVEMKVHTSASAGTIIKLKLEDANGAFVERDRSTTVSGQWEVISWDFTGVPAQFDQIVFMFDFGNVGDGSAASTFFFDDVTQIYSGTQIDWPVNFEGNTVNYTMSDFGGNLSQMVLDPVDTNNHVIEVVKPVGAATWAGTTIGTPAGFATDLPLTMTESFMTVRVWSPDAGTPIRLKVEDSDDPTHTCETETNTTLSKQWETLLFDFTNQAPGTELLSIGLSMGWTYNMASIFFNFDTDGATAGAQTYYFDDVSFGSAGIGVGELETMEVQIHPNPATQYWKVQSSIEIEQIRVYSLQGQAVYEQRLNASSATINCEHLRSGLYVMEFTTARGKYQRRIAKK